MQKIYIARPGAQKEGPYTLEQINRDLATKKINDTDFWAWHEGLPTWLPLYSVSGVNPMAGGAIVHEANPQALPPKAAPQSGVRQVKPESNNSRSRTVSAPTGNAEPEARASSFATPAAELNTERPRPRAQAAPAVLMKPQPLAARIAPEPITAPVKPEPISPAVQTAIPSAARPELEVAATSMSSGKPFAALEQIFVFTTGEGPAAFKSEITAAMLSEAAGEKLATIRSKVPVDVIAGADAKVLEAIRAGSIPGSAWRALVRIKPAVAQQAHDGLYHLCVRTFPVESKELVALFLLYNKMT